MRPATAILMAVLLGTGVAEAAKPSPTPNRFGALAFHKASEAWGAAHDFAQARAARVEALKQCGHPRCEVVHAFKNGCGALADGPKKTVGASGVTRDEAETKALKRCGAEACRIVAWACTR